jgi:S1-C subfamily serine protease
MRKTVSALLMVLVLSLAGCVRGSVVVPDSPTVSERIQNIYNSSVSITDGIGKVHGSGVILQNRAGQKMVVITAAHVVTSMQKSQTLIRISLAYESGWKPMIVKKLDEITDLALLESVEELKIGGPQVSLAAKPPKIGDPLTVIGAPLGDERTVTEGILSGIEKHGNGVFYRVSAAVFFGNSGGGAFNRNGELVGVAHAIQMLGGFIVVPGAAFFVNLDAIKAFM